MILYTMMPEELVFPMEAADYGKQQVVMQNGVPLLVEMEEGNSCRVLRVMSSDPNHYMQETIAPGTKLSLS